MRLTGDPARFSLQDLAAACSDPAAAPTRAFVERLQVDARRGARALGERLARRLEDDSRERARRARMLQIERRWWSAGVRLVAGVDEVGMGPLAGPVVAAAVIFSPDAPVCEVDDSKQLEAEERARLDAIVRERAIAWSIGVATVDEIAATDVHEAGLLAMRRAVLGLAPSPERVLVDARTIPELPMAQEAHVKGDAKSCSIAAASIVAKVHRDAVMVELSARHPGYGFEVHAGYSTPDHIAALRRLGPCAAHRMGWRALPDLAGDLSAAFYRLKAALRESPDDLCGWKDSVQRALPDLSSDEVHRLEDLARRRRPRRDATASSQLGFAAPDA